MSQLNLKYGLNDRPPLLELIIYGIQWMVIAIPMIITVGKVVAGIQLDTPAEAVGYIQKIFLVIGTSVIIQVLWGHQLPLIIGPAAVLLVGVTASIGYNPASVYTSILLCGVLLVILSITGLFSRVKKLFTPIVIVTILMLIGFTLTPTILNLITGTGNPDLHPSALFNLSFALIMVFAMFVASRFLKGFWKSTLIIWSMIVGSAVYFLFAPPNLSSLSNPGSISGLWQNLNLSWVFEPGVFISFLICFLALTINDIGSIESIGGMLNAEEMPKRLSKGVTFTGMMNVLSGLFGVLGPVNYSLSPGVIASTGVASRFALLPAGIGLLAFAFVPSLIAVISLIPSVVIGATFLYTLCSQVAAGLIMGYNSVKPFTLDSGLILALPLMLSVIISFLPSEVVNAFPSVLRPVLGNGFVIGVISVMIMEHLIFKKKLH